MYTDFRSSSLICSCTVYSSGGQFGDSVLLIAAQSGQFGDVVLCIAAVGTALVIAAVIPRSL